MVDVDVLNSDPNKLTVARLSPFVMEITEVRDNISSKVQVERIILVREALIRQLAALDAIIAKAKESGCVFPE